MIGELLLACLWLFGSIITLAFVGTLLVGCLYLIIKIVIDIVDYIKGE